MDSAKGLLEYAEARASATKFTFEDVERRRTRRDRRRQIGTITLALLLAAIALGSASLALRAPDASTVGSGGPHTPLPAPSRAPQVAGPGEFYYLAVLLAADGCLESVSGDGPVGSTSSGECGLTGTRLDVTWWWRDDNAGRVVVDQRSGYGIDAGRFQPGEFPNWNGIDVSDFPLETTALTRFLLERSAEGGLSPAPLVTPPPQGGLNDGQLWRSITDLLQDPHVTPTVRAALLEVAATLQGSHVVTDILDPAGRPAHVIEFGNWGGDVSERLYVDPQTHEMLAWTQSSRTVPDAFSIYLVQDAGVVASEELAPEDGERSVPLTILSADDLADFARGS